ncbi:MAG: tetratricopeptide repeat protein [Casimicrobiaceae bacterium]
MRHALPTLLALLYCVAPAATAQVELNVDYYFDRSNATLLQQLSNVERFHLPGCGDAAKSRQFEPALADCEFILRYFPNHPKALLALADICLAWKNPRCNPDPYFDNAISVNPNTSSTYSARGIYLLRANRVSEAVAALKQAVAVDPNSVNAQYNLGLAYVEAKQYELANQHAQRAYELGAPVPGLRERLRKAGFWKPDAASSPVAAPDAAKGPGAGGAKQ